jgi:flavin reductase (DIM6/NTAB) family NADH-FMN oxidoreductase RutF
MECKVEHIIELGSHHLFIGKIEETYVSDNCLTAGKPDVNKIKPFIYIGDPSYQYVVYGEVLAKPFNVGKTLVK